MTEEEHTLHSHKEEINDDRRAIAPYNFVQLPERVVPAQEQHVRHDTYCGHTGSITCTFEAVTPIYVRTGLSPEQFAAISKKSFHDLTQEEQREYAEFFRLNGKPTIPGSSIRGMLRSLVEIAAHGKVTRVTDKPRYFYRAVAAKRDDPLANPYKTAVNHRRIQAGYIVEKDTHWYIRPATSVDNVTYLWVKEHSIQSSTLVKFADEGYFLQTHSVSFTEFRRNQTGKCFAENVVEGGNGRYKGTLVTSGNMAESGQNTDTPRKNHCVVPEADTEKRLLRIDATAVADYRTGLTDFQKDSFSGENGILKEGQPVFYLSPEQGKDVIYFGHSPYFRIPYRFDGSKHAASPRDFVPERLRDDSVVDIAEAMFGYVRDGKAGEKEQAYAGRVFVEDAQGSGEPLSAKWFHPHILSSPKPTTFQHYLVQPNDTQSNLKHYASTPEKDTVIRGHKLYWHQGHVENWQEHLRDEAAPEKTTQHTSMCPLAPGATFAVRIRFENLSDEELGALLWVLQCASKRTADGKPSHCLKLGMGKPLGMGSVAVRDVRLTCSDRMARYTTLFDDAGQWATGEDEPITVAADDSRIAAFKEYVHENCGEKKVKSFDELPRIQQLLTMLSYPGPGEVETRYMEIERSCDKGHNNGLVKNGKVNEYARRPVLPRPEQIDSKPLTEERSHDCTEQQGNRGGGNRGGGNRGGGNRGGGNRGG